ncbi:hypothetical protein SE17_11365 [Kouleothrix aurantiaca]|uniref:Carbohydrate kinase FGGY N-terminal domain-containing protein n=1 Tax=Kouleothrix aurantiaca TaxID=186479 RepID=A0A0P9DI97_9CHLR|nr:hypothetical protein SE17_11365 [Kouleothrix aurantiaca]
MRYLGIDLGTTFIKGAVLDLASGTLGAIQRRPFPEPVPGLPAGYFEVAPGAIVAAVRDLIGELLRAAPDSSGLMLSSQMHALVLCDSNGEPASNVVTWRDSRALDRHPAGGTFFERLAAQLSEGDRQALGNELRPGLPICALFWMREMGALPAGTIALGLADFVLWQLCGHEPATEPTIAASQGAFNIGTGDWHRSLLERLGLGGVRWPPIGAFNQPAGEMRLGDCTLACFPGVGDQQSALASAALQPGELSLNISTGSQASLLRSDIVPGDYGIRPYFGGQWLHTITNVPAGRALALLVDLLTELPRAQGLALSDPWGYIAQAVAATPATDLTADLSFFGSVNGGALGNIHEGNLSAGHLFRATFEYMAGQYAACAQRLAPAADWERIVFSGGLVQAMPPLRAAIMQRLGGTYRLCDTNEDALAGLLVLARLADEQRKLA